MIKVIGYIGRDSDVENRFLQETLDFPEAPLDVTKQGVLYQLSNINSVNSKQLFLQQLASMAKLQFWHLRFWTMETCLLPYEPSIWKCRKCRMCSFLLVWRFVYVQGSKTSNTTTAFHRRSFRVWATNSWNTVLSNKFLWKHATSKSALWELSTQTSHH